MKIINPIIFLVALLLYCGTSYAATLNVNSATGNDSNTYAQVSAGTHSWATIGRAVWGSTDPTSPDMAQAAAAGDVVLVAAGTYTSAGTLTSCGSNGRLTPILNPANTGTYGNPITFRGVGTVNLRSAEGYVGPIIGANGKNYIIWDNFQIDEAYITTCSDTGPVVFWSADNCQIINSTITGLGDIARGDNYTGIRMEDCQYLTIKNNRISNFGPTEGHNSAGIMTYYSGGLLAENNEISGCGVGIFLKANTTPSYPDANGNRTWNTINKNYIHDCPGGINLLRTHQEDQLQKITQNILKNITGDEAAIKIGSWDDEDSPATNVKVVNNTIIDSLYAFAIGEMYTVPTNNVYWNNIAYRSTSGGSSVRLDWGNTNYDGLAKTHSDFEHNLYYNYTNQLSGEGVSSLSLATWKSTHGQDAASPEASTSDPLFVSYATGNYKLQSGSPALTLGVDILDLDSDGQTNDTIPAGAYITGNETIGIETSTSARKLNNVTGVRVTLH